MRPTTQPGDVDVGDRNSTFYSGANIDKVNALLNSVLIYEEDFDSVEELWRQLVTCVPQIEHSDWFNAQYETDRFVLGTNLQAAPGFERHITSGTKTSTVNTDFVIRVNFTSVPAAPLRADSYLVSDALIVAEGNQLKIFY